MITDQYEFFDYQTANYTEQKKKEPISIFAIQPTQDKVIFVRPKYKDRRYQNQKSVFSCPKDPHKSLDIEGMKKIAFSGKLKPFLRNRLRKMGISTSFIYPGIGGIASEVKSFYYDPVSSGRTQIILSRVEVRL